MSIFPFVIIYINDVGTHVNAGLVEANGSDEALGKANRIGNIITNGECKFHAQIGADQIIDPDRPNDIRVDRIGKATI